MKAILLVVFSLLFASCTTEKDSPYVIMLSMDGFRWDYASKTETPNFDRLVREGVHAASLIPSYPSKTFPNHYSMATGLYPDNHGIVQNNFYDPELKRDFTIRNRDAVGDSAFWGGEPIWETAEKQGVKSASYFWVGTESNATFRPSTRKMYEHSFPFNNRIDSVISWLYLPKRERPHLTLFYFHEPDGVGHDFGPDSPETIQMISELDKYLGDFLDKLEKAEKDLGIEVNFILTSDHGMGAIPADHNIVLSEIIDSERMKRIHGGNPVYLISPEDDYAQEFYSLLSATPNLRVWKKDELPEHYHYGTNPRIEEFIVEANRGWGLSFSDRKRGYSAGTHGYDPRNSDMHGIFYAKGPAFKTGYVHESFENVNLYSLIAEILRLKPASTDGELKNISSMLVTTE
ncbi:MAG: ectonucleotide pyrophosphatase/phosphodiesterase [Bacteroidota bacterium]|nr:ectonucleotide pyrophosphatase/phosphodiesterase [Bacteroidota bacterium]